MNLNWQSKANCRGESTEAFYPEPDKSRDAAVKNLCDTCPVRTECLEHALTYGEWGIWGGTDDKERRRITRWRHANG